MSTQNYLSHFLYAVSQTGFRGCVNEWFAGRISSNRAFSAWCKHMLVYMFHTEPIYSQDGPLGRVGGLLWATSHGGPPATEGGFTFTVFFEKLGYRVILPRGGAYY